jgi:ADP-dependent NAD(P)H-hydrate dehydratase / NAD(P)H-hydrate epimerase
MPILPVLPSTRAWQLHDEQASRKVEQAHQAQLPRHALIERAGLAIARLALAIAPHARHVWVAAGGGNNGGDGLIAACHLKRAGKDVQVAFVGDASRLPPDAAHAHAMAQAAGVRVEASCPDIGQADLVIDALLGLGIRQAPRDPVASLISRINGSGRTVLAVDLPSGLPADTGAATHEVVRATHTLALLTLKPGLFTADGRDHAGRVWFDDLGTDQALVEGTATATLSGPPPIRERRHAQHKGSFGDVLVVGGADGMGGAPLLAARAALTAGAGRVWVARPGRTPGNDLPWPELMQRGLHEVMEPRLLAGATVVCGCGGGPAIADHMPLLLEHARHLVLDADALNALARSPQLQAALASRDNQGRTTVLTPHPLEAARLLDTTTTVVQQDRLAAARTLAQTFRCTVLLKGSGSVIVAPDQAPHINPTGNARLATAGSGDVLAGWIGGQWASASGTALPMAVAASAAWLHGRAAEASPGPSPLTASALIDQLTHAPD